VIYFRTVKSFYSKDFRLGILGGGQLGRMLIQEAVNLDIRVAVLDPSPDAPCSKIAHEFICGDFMDFQTVIEFGKKVDVLTIEIEHVNVDALDELVSLGKKVYPEPSFLRMVQDKGLQKEFFEKNHIATASFFLVQTREDLLKLNSPTPFIQKLRRGGYDGKGVLAIRSAESLQKESFDAPSVIEEMINFEKEIAVIIARNVSGEVKTFPLVEMEFNAEANLVEFLFSPANVSDVIEKEAIRLAHLIVEKTEFIGLLAVEMFVTKNGEVLVNEMAPRPHNSGHHTIEACPTSQYAQHLRAILNLPLGDTALLLPSVMINLLGEKGFSGPVVYSGLAEALATPGVFIHLYGKSDTRPFRKMGHVTITDINPSLAHSKARQIARLIKVVS
jgi:5-(carboxyamino)imidazole ribonucleotide synthase